MGKHGKLKFENKQEINNGRNNARNIWSVAGNEQNNVSSVKAKKVSKIMINHESGMFLRCFNMTLFIVCWPLKTEVITLALVDAMETIKEWRLPTRSLMFED